MKMEFTHVVLHPIAVSAEKIVDTVKQYWSEQCDWKNPGYHYIVGASGKIEKLFLERNDNIGRKKKAIHFSFVEGVDSDPKYAKNLLELQIQAVMNTIAGLGIKYPIRLVGELSLVVSEN